MSALSRRPAKYEECFADDEKCPLCEGEWDMPNAVVLYPTGYWLEPQIKVCDHPFHDDPEYDDEWRAPYA